MFILTSHLLSQHILFMFPFSILGGGLVAIPNNPNLLLKLMKPVFDRSNCLYPGRWMDFLRNHDGLRTFWREIESVSQYLAAEKREMVIEKLRCAVTPLIKNPENEIFFGHDRFRLLKTAAKLQNQLPTENAVSIVEKINESMKPFQIPLI